MYMIFLEVYVSFDCHLTSFAKDGSFFALFLGFQLLGYSLFLLLIALRYYAGVPIRYVVVLKASWGISYDYTKVKMILKNHFNFFTLFFLDVFFKFCLGLFNDLYCIIILVICTRISSYVLISVRRC